VMTSLPPYVVNSEPLTTKMSPFDISNIYGIERVQRDLYVCLLDTTVSPMKRAEPIEVPFGVWTRVSQGTMY